MQLQGRTHPLADAARGGATPPRREVRHPRLPRCGAHRSADAAVGARARDRGLAEESQGMRQRGRLAGRIGASLVGLLLAAGGAAADYPPPAEGDFLIRDFRLDRKSTRLNSSHGYISYAVFCLKKKHT